MLVTALEASPEVPKLEVVTKRLLPEESKQREKEVAEDAEVKALQSKHRKAGRTKMDHCGKTGHIRRECWSSQKVLEKGRVSTQKTLSRDHIRADNMCF